jgi:glycosyltransferase involved in cell wall biosynthesis
VIDASTSDARRVAVLFHESEVLGAGVSVLRAIDELKPYGWTFSGWFPGPGPLVTESTAVLVGQGQRPKPIAFSVRGWRRPPGVLSRLSETPRYLRSLSAWLRMMRTELVHANSLLVLPEATIAHRLGIPVVLQVHELPPPRPKRSATIRWAGSVADVLVGVSTPVSEMLRAHAGPTPVVTVANGVPEFALARPEAGRFVVGTVGYVSRTKGTDIFLRAAELALRQRAELEFEHAGAARLWGDDHFDELVDKLAALPELRANLSLLGRVNVPEVLARWRIFVLPSRQEAFPLSTLEAMSAGLPVIATAVGGVPEQITHLETGILVSPDDTAELARWIIRLYDDPDLRIRLGDAARRHVRESFTLAAQAEGLNAAYEEALRRSSRRRAGRWPRFVRPADSLDSG